MQLPTADLNELAKGKTWEGEQNYAYAWKMMGDEDIIPYGKLVPALASTALSG